MLAAGIITSIESWWTSPVVIARKSMDPHSSESNIKSWIRLCMQIVGLRPDLTKMLMTWDEARSSQRYFSSKNIFKLRGIQSARVTLLLFVGIGHYSLKWCHSVWWTHKPSFRRWWIDFFNVTSVLCYVGDVVVFSKTTEERAIYLKNLLNILKNSGLSLKIKECSCMRIILELIRHILTEVEMWEPGYRLLPERNFGLA